MPEDAIDRDVLLQWLARSGAFGGSDETVIEPLAGDVSQRRYYRIRDGNGSAVVAYYPPALREASHRFCRSSELLAAVGVRVPAILAVDHDLGLMLLEDVGPETLFDRRQRPWSDLRPSLETAWNDAQRVSAIEPRELAALLPPLDAAVLEREIAMTWDVFLVPEGLVDDDPLARRLRSSLERLCADLGSGDLVPCHRDLMARNLVPVPATGELVVLDHQDLRLGPPTYDAASLFNDSLYPSESRVEAILGSVLYRSASYHRAVVQRTWKIVGTFAAFARRGRPQYLPLLPVSLRRGLDHLAALEEEAGLAAELRRRWAGALEAPRGLLE